MNHKTPEPFHIVLYKPEIPYNTGNIIRLCANTGSTLHLIRPIGFEMEESRLKRAALDYSDLAIVTEYEHLDTYLSTHAQRRIFVASSRNKREYTDPKYTEGDSFLFGPESAGLPDAVIERFSSEGRIRIPMMPSNRSLNLANAVAVVIYEAWRQIDFSGKDIV